MRAPHCGVLWRFPTLPHPLGCSTIGAAGLSFQVRNVAGRFPGAVTTTRLCRPSPPCWPAVWRGFLARRVAGWGWVGRGSYSGCGVLPPGWCRGPVVGLWARGVVLVSLSPPVRGWGGWCGVGPLVPVGSRAPRGASTSGLSTRCSGGGLSPRVGAWKPHLGAGFPLRCFQRLSFPNVANQPCTWRYNWHTRGSSIPVLSYWGRPSIKFPARAEDRDRTVSRRSEPSSRTALMGEQPNPWDLLQPQDATSRHRGAKPCRRYGLLGKISLLSPGYLLSVERPRTHVPWPDH